VGVKQRIYRNVFKIFDAHLIRKIERIKNARPRNSIARGVTVPRPYGMGTITPITSIKTATRSHRFPTNKSAEPD
jgi:hypothetical protein